MSENEDKENIEAERRGDAILQRMLKSKPKPHKKAVEERKAKRNRDTKTAK